MEDPLAFLARSGFPVTRTAGGRFDIPNLAMGMTAGEVIGLWLRLRCWPEPAPDVGHWMPADGGLDGRGDAVQAALSIV